MSAITSEHVSWWAVCDDCKATIRVESHPERMQPVPDPDEEWGGRSDECPVCLGQIFWNSDPQVTR